MNQNDSQPGAFGSLRSLLSDRNSDSRFQAALMGGLFLLCALAFTLSGPAGRSARLEGFEVGKVADRDVTAEMDVVYSDAQATAARIEEEQRKVAAVFVLDETVTEGALSDFERFRTFFLEQPEDLPGDELAKRMETAYPLLAKTGLPAKLMAYPAPESAFSQASALLQAVLATGVVAIPEKGLDSYKPDAVELRRWDNGPLVFEEVPLERLVTARNVDGALQKLAAGRKLSGDLADVAVGLASAFALENAFFDDAMSQRRLEAAAASVEPVLRRIAKGERVIREGFIVTSEDMERLAALRRTDIRFNVLGMFGGLLYLGALLLGTWQLLSRERPRRGFGRAAMALVSGLFVLYFCIAAVLYAILDPSMAGILAVAMPTALLSILMAILFSERFAATYTVALALGVFLAGGLSGEALGLALSSGLAGILLVRKAEKRIDLVRAGAQLAVVQFLIGLALAAVGGKAFLDAVGLASWAAVNGFFCSVLALGFLPLIEQALNAATVFRLQELSDLNAPALKRLLSVAPGTYSHSITVAHLAESACREIGADALLARVGAYYHDIGKTEQPEYFIENQSGYNKHDDINPRLSATVLRSHVKFGLERAQALGLPGPVREIIGEHHGTSLISYFYSQAQKESPDVPSEDFSYPGPLPSSKEAAVVMLADCVEAASRTLKKPSMARLEQFVREMVMDKFDHGQLAQSELTFRDLEKIRNTFIRILAGHFHSRIEYPKAREAQR
ncbi:MAG: HDIG domain-containing protein [Spirochaetales bacterium]|nr:HDIG domain-containing protein [Spirochaetales bacterium]